jgi:hypothetical protein
MHLIRWRLPTSIHPRFGPASEDWMRALESPVMGVDFPDICEQVERAFWISSVDEFFQQVGHCRSLMSGAFGKNYVLGCGTPQLASITAIGGFPVICR